MRLRASGHRALIFSLVTFAGTLLGCEKNFRDASSATGGDGSGGAATGGTVASGGVSGSGSSTAGGGDGSFFGASRCDAGEFLLCDGFETKSIDVAKWTIEKAGSNVVEITSNERARGAQSIHIHTLTDKFAFLRTTSVFPLATNDYYGRMFVRFARFSKVEWAHWTIAEAAGTGDGSLIRVGGQYRTDLALNRWGIGSDGGPTGDWTTHDEDPEGTPSEPLLDTWHCVEWAHLGSTDETRFYLDGVEHPSLATTASKHGGSAVPYVMPEFTSVWFGWYQYQPDPEAFDLWIDEIALDDERIGCER